MLNDAQRVQVMVKMLAMLLHLGIQGVLACVTEGWMTDVVAKGERLNQVDIQLECASNGARDLRDFDSVREAVAKVI